MLDLIHNNIVFELRYNFGYEYYDNCGITLNEIIKNIHPFSVNEVNINTGNLLDEENNIAVSFNASKLDISQRQTEKVDQILPINQFSDLSDKISQVILKNFNIFSLSRIGCRNFFLLSFESMELCINYLHSMKIFKDFLKQYIFENLSEIDFSFTFYEDLLKVKFKILPGEQNVNINKNIIATSLIQPDRLSRNQKKARIDKLRAQKYLKNFPNFFLLFDIDISDEYPDDDITSINYDKFIQDSKNKSIEYIEKFLK